MKSMKVCVLSLALFIGLSQSHQCPDSGSASASSSEEMMMSGESEEMMMSGESGEMMMSEESGESSSSSTEEEEETERRRRGLKMQKCKKKGMTPTKVEELESLENVSENATKMRIAKRGDFVKKPKPVNSSPALSL